MTAHGTVDTLPAAVAKRILWCCGVVIPIPMPQAKHIPLRTNAEARRATGTASVHKGYPNRARSTAQLFLEHGMSLSMAYWSLRTPAVAAAWHIPATKSCYNGQI
jgi:hypothetical protein